MSGLPVVLDASRLDALVVGGGAVATRRATALARRGARVRVIAPRIAAPLHALAAAEPRVRLDERPFAAGDVGDAQLVVAATDDRAVNAAVAAEAHAAGRLVVVADAPDEGNCAFAAAHAAGDLVIGVNAGGVPGAASRVRDAIALRFDARYGEAVRRLAELRRSLLGAGRRDEWTRAAAELVGDDFCDSVERGEFGARAAAWR